MAIKPNIGTKTDYAARPSVPSGQKKSAAEFNLLVAAVRANYERLILDWDVDIDANVNLAVGQYILYDDGSSIGIYKIDTAYNVGNPITWDVAKATLIIASSPNRFKGVYANEAALEAAHPSATAGDYALVDTAGPDAQLFIWDNTDTDWVASGITTVVPDASTTDKGIIEIATVAEALTGTDAVRALTPAALEGKRSLKRKVATFAGSTLTVDCESKEEVKSEYTTTLSANFTLALSNTTNLELLLLIIKLTGTVAITMPSTFRMLEDDVRWNNTTKILTIVSGTNSFHELSIDTVSGPIHLLKVTSKYYPA